MTVTARSSVFIVDDHALIREALEEYLTLASDLRVCGAAASGAEALERIPFEGCDVAIVDVSMPGMSGIELLRRLKEARPGLRCLMLSGHAEEVYVREAMRAGAHGYVMKGDPAALVDAVRRVLNGEVYLSERVRGTLRDGDG